MPTFGVTPEGFVLKRLPDILTDYETALATVQDPVSGEYLTPNLSDENDPLIQMINATADGIAEAWEQLQICYNQFDPLKASGAGMSGTFQLNGLTRLPGSYTVETFQCTGTPNKIIPAGQKVTDANQETIFTLDGFTFDGSGDATVLGTCTVKGPVDPADGTFVNIMTPVADWSSVTNSGPTTVGTDEETDSAFRFRQQRSTTSTGVAPIDTTYGAISEISGVTFCRVYQNRTLSTDSRGIPAKNVAAVVVGGDDDLITDALWQKCPLGSETYGTTTVNKTDVQGITYPVKFSRPTPVDAFIEMELSITQSSIWPSDGIDQVKAAILQYAATGAAALGIETGFDQNGYLPGESVYASELYVPVMSIGGCRINSLFVGATAGPTGDTLDIEWDEIAAFDSANISVTVV